MKSKINISIIGNDAELREFLKLCRYVQSFGAYGMSRTVHVNIDGDGSGRLQFQYTDDDNNDVEFLNFDMKALRAVADTTGEYNVDIGE